MTEIETDLTELCARAKGYGAARVSVLPASQVVVDPRVRLKCLVPCCPHYGVNLMCPPRVMGPDEFSEILARYNHAILVQYPIVEDPVKMHQLIDGKTLESLRSEPEYSSGLISSLIEFVDILSKVERDAVNMGYRFSTALSAGSCRLCDRCVGQRAGGPCKHPYKARPSMEAMGIDVFKTAENAGMPLTGQDGNMALWTGLLLVD